MKNILSKKNILLIVFCLGSHFNDAQNLKIDSINNFLRNYSLKDTTRVNLLIEKATLYQNINIDSMYANAVMGKQLANELKFSQGEAENLMLIGDYFRRDHQLKESEKFTESALIIFEENKDIEGILKCSGNLAYIAYSQFQFDKALFYYEKIATIHAQENNEEYLINTLGMIAEIYQKQEDFSKAKESFIKILELAKKIDYQRAITMAYYSLGKISSATNKFPEAIDDFNKALIRAKEMNDMAMIPVLFHNIGTVYLKQKNHEKSLEYMDKAFSLYKENEDYWNIMICLNDLGSLSKEKREYQKAKGYYEEALEIADKQQPSHIITTILNNMGHLYVDLGKYQKSISYFEKGLAMAITIQSKERVFYSYLGLGKVYCEIQKYDLALANALKGLQLIEEINLVNHRNEIYELLADIYAKTGQYKKAYENQVLFKIYTDSAFNSETTEKITKLETEYKYREEKLLAKQKEENLMIENERTKENLVLVKNQQLWMVIGILLLALILVYVIMNHNVKDLHLKTKNVLTEQKLLRSQMTPHFMFNSLSVLQGIILNKEYDKSLNYIDKFSSLLRLSLENSRLTLVLLDKEIKAIEKYLIVQNIARNFPFRYEILLDDAINRNELLIPPMLIQPFVENAVKHGFRELKEDQEISIVFTYSQQNLTCSITDNGVGIDIHQNKYTSANTSISTDLIRERLEILGSEFGAKLGITIRDRREINKSGTVVIINLPYKIQIYDENTDSRG